MASEIVQSLKNSVLVEQPQVNLATTDILNITCGKDYPSLKMLLCTPALILTL